MNVLIAPDKFKGTLTAIEAAKAIKQGWLNIRNNDRTRVLPISDGGDGFGITLRNLLNAKDASVHTVDAAHRPINADWWFDEKTKTAIIESACIIGIALLPPDKYHPFELDTSGLANALKEAASRNLDKCIIGIGGSSTNDAGFGMAKALGWEFLNADGNEIQTWTDLRQLKSITPPKTQLPFKRIIVAVDVNNPLLGTKGATRIYGPQKGLKISEFDRAEACLARLAEIAAAQTGVDLSKSPGAGAAGGLGFGLAFFTGAEIKPGFDLFAEYSKIDEQIRNSNLVITGEGALDASSLMGKGVGALAEKCSHAHVPCIGLGGVLNDISKLHSNFTEVLGIVPLLATPKESSIKPAEFLTRLAEKAAKIWTEEHE
ncbi:MAG: glycerate kinase [Verrucomicrobia bacterium]|nr:glycerate kinase [Verrucomicrobiota bacterium]